MDELFTIREVAEKLKISVSSIYRYVETDRFPHIKLGSNIRFNKDHIATFIAETQKKTKGYVAYPSPTELEAIYDQL
jgi:excisionase family DNA binding protein